MQLATTVGPLVSGLLIVHVGVPGALTVNLVLQLVSAAAILPMRAYPADPGAASQTVFSAMREGWAYAWVAPPIRWTLTLWLIYALFAQPLQQMLPAFAVAGLHVGIAELSLLMTALGTGSLAAAVFVGTLGWVQRRGRVVLAGTLLAGMFIAALAVQTALAPAIVIAAILGFIQQLTFAMGMIVLQFASPESLRGRILGLQTLTFHAIAPFGGFAVGSVAALFGIGPTLAGAGLITATLAGMVFVAAPEYRRFRSGREHAPPEPRYT
ncbi:MAG: MFS transporter [Chloroflexi bacterium]|nr:MFS transporter [Chloroflexota bacterium]